MILSGNGQNIYPEEVEDKLNNMYLVLESLILETENGKLKALVVPDYEQADHLGIGMNGIREMMDANLAALNASLGDAPHIEAIILYPSEFEKTPANFIQRAAGASPLREMRRCFFRPSEYRNLRRQTKKSPKPVTHRRPAGRSARPSPPRSHNHRRRR